MNFIQIIDWVFIILLFLIVKTEMEINALRKERLGLMKEQTKNMRSMLKEVKKLH